LMNSSRNLYIHGCPHFALIHDKGIDTIRSHAAEGSGVILYLRQEGRGVGLINKLKAYELQRCEGMDTMEANLTLGIKDDMRDYGIGAQMLVDIGVREMRLLTNNHKKMVGLQGYGLCVAEQVPIEVEPNEHNRCYLECKKLKMGHTLSFEKIEKSQ